MLVFGTFRLKWFNYSDWADFTLILFYLLGICYRFGFNYPCFNLLFLSSRDSFPSPPPVSILFESMIASYEVSVACATDVSYSAFFLSTSPSIKGKSISIAPVFGRDPPPNCIVALLKCGLSCLSGEGLYCLTRFFGDFRWRRTIISRSLIFSAFGCFTGLPNLGCRFSRALASVSKTELPPALSKRPTLPSISAFEANPYVSS